jgi:hypothetical protein
MEEFVVCRYCGQPRTQGYHRCVFDGSKPVTETQEQVTKTPTPVTISEPVTKRGRGRPRKYGTHAERQEAYRQRKKEQRP